MKKIDINDCIRRIKNEDPLVYESAFIELEENILKYKDEVLKAMLSEKKSFTRGKFIELLGLCKTENLLIFFEDELSKKDKNTIPWVLSAIESIASKKAMDILENFKKNNPGWD